MDSDPQRYSDAIREGIADAMREDPLVCLMGIDVGRGGGVYGITRGLFDEFGPARVRDTPIAETGFVGAAVGAAAAGAKPIVELMYMDFLGVCFDVLLNQASKLRYMTGGAVEVPMVLRTQTGWGRSNGAQHSQSLEAILAHIPGLKVVMPASVEDAYGLLRAAVDDPNPVVFIENRRLYNKRGTFGPPARIGEAATVRAGADVTVVAWSRLVDIALSAANDLAGTIDVEVIDLRSIAPLDIETVIRSVQRTSRLVVAHDAVLDFGAGAEIVARVVNEAFDYLDAPPERVGAPPVPAPFSPALEAAIVPDVEAVKRAIRWTTDSV
ncbi:MAG: 2-oxoisovalerate dehydrogenase component [Thermoleophilaceae bacterium]|nr:2-oxoisovalerate dehydrogenase component [Thermoleophilaceae bacterium]